MKYHHGDLREALILSACMVCEDLGFEKISLRSIAKGANVSQTAPYRHFKTKKELLAEVARCGFDELRTKLLQSLEDNKSTNPKEQFINLGVAYLEFGMNKRNTYDLMMHHQGFLNFGDFPSLEKSGEETFNILIETMLKIMPNLSAEELYVQCIKHWSMIHGLIGVIDNLAADNNSATNAATAIKYVKDDIKSFLRKAIDF